MNSQTKKSGFTIIEVVLVLAIAGLIFLIVFLAVPALQRSQRDQARRSDMGRVIAAVQDYRGNHQGQLPVFTGTTFRDKIAVDSSFEDPSGGNYSFIAGAPDNIATGALQYQVGSKCDGATGAFVTNAGTRKVAFRMQLESGDIYCQSN